MVNLKILSGKQAGAAWSARRFPFSVGRAATADLKLDDPGIWDRHFEISLQQPDGFVLRSDEQASVVVGGNPVKEAVLKNGDVIEAGAVKIRFYLSATPQKSFTMREWCTWIGLATLSLGQVALIYWLSR